MPAKRAGTDIEGMSGVFLTSLFDYLERAGGPGLVADVVSRAGCADSVEELRARKWGGLADLLAVIDAAFALTGESELGRRTGEEMFRSSLSNPAIRSYFISQGDPAAALVAVLEHSVKLGTGRSYRVVSSDESGSVIEGLYDEDTAGHPFFCGIALGYWPAVAALFGAVGTSTHPSCQCRGDDVCTFVIRWDRGAAGSAAEVEAANADLSWRLRSFEEMQAVSEQLARAADLEALAERILDGLETVANAPQLLVVLEPGSRRAPIIRTRRLAPDTAASMVEDIRAGRATTVVAAAPLGGFGLVAALAPDAQHRSETTARLLEAFARHATARIEAVMAREAAEQSGQTADALLQLARELAEATTTEEVSDRLVRSIPGLVGADHSCVLRWDPKANALVPEAYLGPEGVPPFDDFNFDRVPGLTEVVNSPAPMLIDRDRCDPYVAASMEAWNEQINILAPVTDDGVLYGLVSAGFEEAVTVDRAAAFARLKGAADLAVTAYAKARLLEEIRHQALHDSLTGLPNRALLESRVSASISAARRSHQGMALLFLDLDRFKNVNDSMGHDFGDSLINGAALRIQKCLSADDFLARMGGDEFVIVLDNVTSAVEVEAVADRVLAQLRMPLEIDGHSLYISASIGVGVYPEDGTDYGQLLQTADSSMYAAKRAGGGTVRRRAHAPDAADVQRRLNLETELHRALERDEITVVYQPQVALSDLRIVGVEALVRWQHPELGMIGPSEFLGVAEDSGMLPALDRRVRRLAFAQAREWQQTIGPITVAVNLAAQTLCRPGLLQEMGLDLDESGSDPTAIEIELTEGMVGDDDLIPVVEGLAAMGFRVAIDDFGTGASVFARLKQLPIDTLKIDRSLVQVGSSRRDTSILGAIIRMSHSMGFTVVAEGVETPGQAARLRKEACDSAQGFLFGRPMAVAEIEAIMYSQAANLDHDFRRKSAAERPTARSATHAV
jgi:diguanylate cyclase (GGDEF)-like protein